MKGPAIFLAQFAGTEPPFDKLETMAQWAVSLGYVGVLCKASSSRSSRLPRLNSRVSRRRTFVKSRMRGPRSNSKILGLDE